MSNQEEQIAFIAEEMPGASAVPPGSSVMPTQDMSFAANPGTNVSAGNMEEGISMTSTSTSYAAPFSNSHNNTSRGLMESMSLSTGAEGRAPRYYPIQQQDQDPTSAAQATQEPQQHVNAIPATYVPNSIRPPKIIHPDFAPPPSQKKKNSIAIVGVLLAAFSFFEDGVFDEERRDISEWTAVSEFIEISATLLFIGGAFAGYKTGQWRCLVPGLVLHFAAVEILEVVILGWIFAIFCCM